MAILIKANGQVSDITDISYDGIKNAIDGWLENVAFPFKGCKGLVGYVDEEGKLKQKPINIKATHLWQKAYNQPLNDFLVGDVLICGDDENGNEIPLTPNQKTFLLNEINNFDFNDMLQITKSIAKCISGEYSTGS